MSVKSYTYISFPGTAKEAFEYYHSIFGGDLQVLTYGQFPEQDAEQFPFEINPDAVANATLDSDVVSIAGGDAMEGDAPGLDGTPYSLLLICDDEAEARGYWDKFTSTGGEIRVRVGWTMGGGQYIAVSDNGPGIAPDEIDPHPAGAGPINSVLISSGPRVGVRRNADVAWRYWITDDPTVSAYRRHPRAD